MKVSEFIKREIDIDVYDNVDESISIAFCGPMELTEEGKTKFADVMNYDIEVDEKYNVAIVNCDFDDYEDRLAKAKRFFYSIAGWCAADDYDRWFKEVE